MTLQAKVSVMLMPLNITGGSQHGGHTGMLHHSVRTALIGLSV